MHKQELEKYLRRLNLDKALLTEASLTGASDYILLLGAVTLQIATVKKILLNLTQHTNEN